MVLLGKFGHLGHLCMHLGGLPAEIAGGRDFYLDFFVLFKLGLLFTHRLFHLLDLLDQLALLISADDFRLLAEFEVLDLLLELLQPTVFQSAVVFLESFDLFKQGIGLFIDHVSLIF